jgi:large subunit ribosomal protein L24
MKFKKGDKVKIMVGKDRGKTGKIEKVYKKQRKALILGTNIYKKHIKKNEKMPQGGVVELPRPIDMSKLMLICPKCEKIIKIGYIIEKNKKYRKCRKCSEKI